MHTGRRPPPTYCHPGITQHGRRAPPPALAPSTPWGASAWRGAPVADDNGVLGALSRSIFVPSCRPTVLGIVGCSLSLLGLVGFGAFALIALALALLGLCDLSLVIFQRTTDTFVEVKARRRFMGQETLRKRIAIIMRASCCPGSSWRGGHR